MNKFLSAGEIGELEFIFRLKDGCPDPIKTLKLGLFDTSTDEQLGETMTCVCSVSLDDPNDPRETVS